MPHAPPSRLCIGLPPGYFDSPEERKRSRCLAVAKSLKEMQAEATEKELPTLSR